MGTEGKAGSRELGEYRGKRNFETTPEPDGGLDRQAAGARFVVHEHRARRLHWDLRLEHAGALASWAIPNGIPEDPEHNRKAIHVEDHPLSYLAFEGTIAPGNYGAGEVRVWDRGTYTCEKWATREILIDFHGERLRGRYALFRAGRGEQDWMIHRMDPPIDPTAEEIPDFIEPMLARLATLPAREPEWAFEVKWDGVRAIARSLPGRIRLLSRNGNDVTAAYPELRALNRELGSHSAVLDGEIVAFDDTGRPSFEALQSRMHLRGEAAVRRRAQATPVTYVLFDLLWLDGHSLLDLPYAERRSRLAALRLDGERWCTPAFHVGEGSALLAATREQGLEGVIAKRLDSRYAPGRRSDSWLKIKHSRRQEVVIGGWTEGKGSRSLSIGALQAGIYENGELRYAGRVGTGFDAQELERLAGLLGPLARRDSPFVGRQPPRGSHFVEPRLVCEVEFSQWTKGGLLRQSSYKGLRADKPAVEVVRERAEPLPESPASSRKEAADIRELIEGARRVRGGVEVELEGRALKLTNLDKVLFPKTGFTKADLIGYYAQVAPVLLPHLVDRPLTLKRYPDGVEGEYFYEKQCPGHRPEWVRTTAVWSESNQREIDYCLCQDLPTLVWLANLADVELHPFLSRAEALKCPRTLLFDLDPGRAGERRGVLPGRARAARDVHRARDARLCQDLRSQGPAGLRTAERERRDLRTDQALRPRRRRPARTAPPGARPIGHVQGAPLGQGARRLEPERRAQDDRLGLLLASHGASPGLHAGGLGRGGAVRHRRNPRIAGFPRRRCAAAGRRAGRPVCRCDHALPAAPGARTVKGSAVRWSPIASAQTARSRVLQADR